MTETETETPTSWKQLRVKTNLGTLVSILVAVCFITFQVTQIRTQIDDNSRAVSTLISAVEELSATVGLTMSSLGFTPTATARRLEDEFNPAVSHATELDQRTNQLYDDISRLRLQFSDQADARIEISTQAERFESARNDLSDLEWRFDDLDRRVSEAFGAEMAGGGEDYSWHEVVGESHYQKALEKAVGRQKDQDGSYWRGTAEIRHDAKNKHDQWAILVTIDGSAVGYLPSADSNRTLAGELAGEPRVVLARIMGGFWLDVGGLAYYGVELVL